MFQRVLLRVCSLMFLMMAPIGAYAAGFISIDNLTPAPGGRWFWGQSQQTFDPSGLHLKSESIKTNIKDHVAKTYITQVFRNDTDRDLAGTYLFPLPKDAAFSAFSLHIDGKMVEGQILEAAAARREYEDIVRRKVDPGLLEYADYKTVRARIFPIPAHGEKRVEFEYTQLLKADNGMMRFYFPLKAQDSSPSSEHVDISVRMESPQGVRTIWSPTHKIETKRTDDNHATVSFAANSVVPDKDFLVYYSLSNKELSANLITQNESGNEGYFLLAVTPPIATDAVAAKDVLLVIDTSGSMEGDKIKQARAALNYIVEGLSDVDRFNIIQFNTDVESFKSELVPATGQNRKAALAVVEKLVASGGTNLGAALSASAQMLAQSSERPAYVILVSDGEASVGETNPKSLAAMLSTKRGIRVFDFGVGYDVNTKLLEKIASAHHGTSQYVESEESLETALSSFYGKIKNPVLTDVSITYQGASVKQVYPPVVKDFFAGSQTLLLGRYDKAGGATLVLTGNLNGVRKSYSFPVSFPNLETQHSYLPRLWAMRRIGYLTEVIEDNGESKEVVDEIVALSKKYGIMSPYTSFLSVAESERRGAGRVLGAASGNLTIGGGGGGSGLTTDGSASFGAHGGHLTVSAGDGGNLSINGNISTAGAGGGGGAFDSAGGDAVTLFSSSSAATGYGQAPLMFNGLLTGKDAVKLSKIVTAYKASDSIGDVRLLASKDERAVEDKTFRLLKGFWTDSIYDAAKFPKPEEIKFGSSRYFELAAGDPKLAKYLAVGQKVIVVHNGHCYKIMEP